MTIDFVPENFMRLLAFLHEFLDEEEFYEAMDALVNERELHMDLRYFDEDHLEPGTLQRGA